MKRIREWLSSRQAQLRNLRNKITQSIHTIIRRIKITPYLFRRRYWRPSREKILNPNFVARGFGIIGLLILISGFCFLYISPNLTLLSGFKQIVEDLYANIGSELLSIAATVLVIEALNRRRAAKETEIYEQQKKEEAEIYEQQKREEAKFNERQRKQEAEARTLYDLKIQMGSPNNAFAVEAVRMLKSRNAQGASENSDDPNDSWLTNGSLDKVQLQKANLNEADMSSARLKKANLEEAILTNSTLILCDFEEADLTQANLKNARLANAELTRVKFENTNLLDADLSNTTLRFADMTSANLQGVILKNANLYDAICSNANLSEAELNDAILQSTQLPNTNLKKANLSNANLRRANLQKAELEGAILEGANLYLADCLGSELPLAIFNQNTILPNGEYWKPGLDLTCFINKYHPDYQTPEQISNRATESL